MCRIIQADECAVCVGAVCVCAVCVCLHVSADAAAELDAFDQWNPTKVFIDVCAALGMCSERRRCQPAAQIARRLALEESAKRGLHGGEHVIPTLHDGHELSLGRKVEGADLADAAVSEFEVVGPPFLRSRVRRAKAKAA